MYITEIVIGQIRTTYHEYSISTLYNINLQTMRENKALHLHFIFYSVIIISKMNMNQNPTFVTPQLLA